MLYLKALCAAVTMPIYSVPAVDESKAGPLLHEVHVYQDLASPMAVPTGEGTYRLSAFATSYNVTQVDTSQVGIASDGSTRVRAHGSADPIGPDVAEVLGTSPRAAILGAPQTPSFTLLGPNLVSRLESL
jgi:hypothetical protein